MNQTRLAIDVGGTFTDVFVFDERTGKVSVTKTSSTPSNPERGILDGIEKAQLNGRDPMRFMNIYQLSQSGL